MVEIPPPKRTLEECHKIMTAPGSFLEMEEETIFGVKFRVYKHLPKSMRDLWMDSAVHGPKDYIVYEGERYTYAQAHDKTREIALLFRDTYNIKKGDRIAMSCRNVPEFIFVYWAIQMVGAIVVSVNAWLPVEVQEHCITFTDSVLLIIDNERAKLLSNSLKTLSGAGCKNILVVRPEGKLPAGMTNLHEVVKPFAGRKDVPQVEILPEDVATIFFTSGTTGLPKGVVGTNRQFVSTTFNGYIAGIRAILRRGDDLPAPDPNALQKSFILGLPLFHGAGNHSVLQPFTHMGGKLVMLYKWDSEKAIDYILKEKITSAGGIPFMASGLLANDKLNSKNSTLESVSWGGGPGSSILGRQLQQRFNSITLPGQGYGATELSSTTTSVIGEDFLRRPTSCGLPVFTIDVKVCDPDGKTLPVGSTGELYWRGVNVTSLGYWKNEKATKENFLPDGWYRSGDIGYVDEEGFCYIQDRQKEIIIRGGENIACIMVENALYEDPRLEVAAVVPIPDDYFGELVGAAVTTRPEYHGKVTEAEIIAICAKILPKHAVPAMVDIRTEDLPRTTVGKIMKRELKGEVIKVWEDRKKSKSKL